MLERKKPVRWIHPQHAKGLRSQNLGRSHVGGKLTDKKIESYKRRGFYGKSWRKIQEERDAERKKKGYNPL